MKNKFAKFFSGQTKHGPVGEWTVSTEVSVTVGERGWLAGYKAAGSLSLSGSGCDWEHKHARRRPFQWLL